MTLCQTVLKLWFFLKWILVKSQTYRQTVMHKSPLCIRTCGLKKDYVLVHYKLCLLMLLARPLNTLHGYVWSARQCSIFFLWSYCITFYRNYFTASHGYFQHMYLHCKCTCMSWFFCTGMSRLSLTSTWPHGHHKGNLLRIFDKDHNSLYNAKSQNNKYVIFLSST